MNENATSIRHDSVPPTERSYSFNVWRGTEIFEQREKTEEQLTQSEKDLMLGELVQKWENNTRENQLRFLEWLLIRQKP